MAWLSRAGKKLGGMALAVIFTLVAVVWYVSPWETQAASAPAPTAQEKWTEGEAIGVLQRHLGEKQVFFGQDTNCLKVLQDYFFAASYEGDGKWSVIALGEQTTSIWHVYQETLGVEIPYLSQNVGGC